MLTTSQLKEYAEMAIEEYDLVHRQGGEIEYPHWADKILHDLEQQAYSMLN